MGSTVSTNKKVCAFVTRAGKTGYVLFEQTYEKNCYPHRPQWSCVAIGYLEQAVKHIFRRAAFCEGGMLQSRHGRITPEGFIRSWYQHLANPYAIHDRNNTLEWSSSFGANLPIRERSEIEASLHEQGFGNLVPELHGRKVSLYLDFDLLCALYNGEILSPWRYDFGLVDFYDSPAHALGYVPKRGPLPNAKLTALLPRALRFGPDEKLVPDEDGNWRAGGWDYSRVGQFIRSYARLELEYPGSYSRAIEAYRTALASAPKVPECAEVAFVPSDMVSWAGWEACMSFMGIDPTSRKPVRMPMAELCKVIGTGNLTSLAHSKLSRWFTP